MKTAITKGLNEQQSEEMRHCFVHAAVLRNQLKKLLEEKINASNRVARSKDAYNIPNWAYLQADAVGYERALTEVINLLTGERSTEQGAEAIPSVIETPKKRRGRPPKSGLLSNA